MSPRQHGYLAYGQGHTLTYCPYDLNTKNGQEWVAGWYAAQRDYQLAYKL